MKIISKYKDYYDYLSGIYGEDPLKVLDRREVDPSDNIRTIVFCDKIYIKEIKGKTVKLYPHRVSQRNTYEKYRI